MNYGSLRGTDIANGEGVRVTLFVSGCTHHCKNCFNPETWNFCYGNPFTKEVEDEIINTNNINIPTTEAVAPIETQVSEEPIQTETAPQVQTQTQTPIAKPAIKPTAQWRTWNTWVYPVWTAKNWWTLMSDWSVRPASYNPNTAIPTWDKKTGNARSNSMNKNIQRLLKSWYTIDNNWFLFNPQWNKVARVWTWSIAPNP